MHLEAEGIGDKCKKDCAHHQSGIRNKKLASAMARVVIGRRRCFHDTIVETANVGSDVSIVFVIIFVLSCCGSMGFIDMTQVSGAAYSNVGCVCWGSCGSIVRSSMHE